MKLFKLPSFIMLSGLGWCIDFTIFNYLVALGHSYFSSNLASATIAVSFVLITARRLVFHNHVEVLHIVIVKYILWNIVAITAASLLISSIATVLGQIDFRLFIGEIKHITGIVLNNAAIASNLSKLLVTPITMYANYVAVGYIIERKFSFC